MNQWRELLHFWPTWCRSSYRAGAARMGPLGELLVVPRHRAHRRFALVACGCIYNSCGDATGDSSTDVRQLIGMVRDPSASSVPDAVRNHPRYPVLFKPRHRSAQQKKDHEQQNQGPRPPRPCKPRQPKPRAAGNSNPDTGWLPSRGLRSDRCIMRWPISDSLEVKVLDYAVSPTLRTSCDRE